MIPTDDQKLLKRLIDHAVDLSVQHVESGGIPFTALVTDSRGTVLGTGTNRVLEDHDPTAHAEVVAIRNASRARKVMSLQGATLIASGEPCAMCYMSALWAGISQIVFAVDRQGAAKAGFDYRSSYELFGSDMSDWPIDIRLYATEDSFRPFELWRQQQEQRRRR